MSGNPMPVHEYVASGNLAGLVRLLLGDPSLLNKRSFPMLETPLHTAASQNRVEMIEYLTDWKGIGNVEMEAANIYNETPLHLAAKNGRNHALTILLEHGADIEARTNNWKTSLHLAVCYAIKSGDNSTVETLMMHNADCSAIDEDDKTPFSYIPRFGNEELRRLVNLYEEGLRNADPSMKKKMDEFNYELSKIVGLHELKLQLQKLAKTMFFDSKRRAMGIPIGPKEPPHMAFLGNPGTGKTTVARTLGKLLCSVGILTSDKVVEVQRTDLVAEYIGHTGPKTQKKIEEARGAILFVDEAYRLVPDQDSRNDFGREALEEIMKVLDDGNLVVIFAGYTEPMKRVLSSNEGFFRRVPNKFHFTNYTCRDLAKILLLKMKRPDKKSPFLGFKLDLPCTVDAITTLISDNSTEEVRNKMNGGLVSNMLNYARQHLDSRLPYNATAQALQTVTLSDLEAGLKTLQRRVNEE